MIIAHNFGFLNPTPSNNQIQGDSDQDRLTIPTPVKLPNTVLGNYGQ